MDNICCIVEKPREFRKKHLLLASLTMLKPLTVWITTDWKILKRIRIPDYFTCLLRNLYAGQEAIVRTGCGITDWFNIGKEEVKAVYCHPACLTSMQSTSCKMPGWMTHKLEQRLPGQMSTTSEMQMIMLWWQKVKRN